MSERTRRVFIISWLLVQIGLPLRYYLRPEAPGSGYDERFAWRMFSPIRMLRCQVAYTHDGQAVQLERRIHSAWITLLKRGRPSVIEGVSRALCREDGPTLSLELSCREQGGERVVLYDGSVDLCTDRVLR